MPTSDQKVKDLKKAKRLPAELWVLMKAACEGRTLGCSEVARLVGVTPHTVIERSIREKWETPRRRANAQEDLIKKTVAEALKFEPMDVAETVEAFAGTTNFKSNVALEREIEKAAEYKEPEPRKLLPKAPEDDSSFEMIEFTTEDLADHPSVLNAISANPRSTEPLRQHLETPAKFRAKDTDMIPQEPQAHGKLAQLEALSKNLESELKKRARTHQLGVAEITQTAVAYLAQAVENDPGLAVLLSDKLEKLDKVARRNLKLDHPDPLGGAKTVIVMSDPEFLPPIPEPTLEDKQEEEPPTEEFEATEEFEDVFLTEKPLST
jgi:hypothetical protein